MLGVLLEVAMPPLSSTIPGTRSRDALTEERRRQTSTSFSVVQREQCMKCRLLSTHTVGILYQGLVAAAQEQSENSSHTGDIWSKCNS